jgi:hypothetical protein
MEWNGMERKGKERNGMEIIYIYPLPKEWKGMEWNGKERKGKEYNIIYIYNMARLNIYI